MNFEINVAWYKLENLSKLNILMWKNWCWKSTTMRTLLNGLKSEASFWSLKYLSPERWGALYYEPNIERSLNDSPSWLEWSRAQNRTDNFRQQTVAQYRNLEIYTLRTFQEDTTRSKFNDVIDNINSLLDNIEIKSEWITFTIYKKWTSEKINPNNISSWETELISLAIECLVFSNELEENKKNILFLDEPDVPLHPDLQVKLMLFLRKLIENNVGLNVIISTHSTAVLWAINHYSEARICFMWNRESELKFQEISEEYEKILPVFWAHPLTNVFNESPLLIVEWEDDVRIWQQAVRSSQWRIKLYPSFAWSISEISPLEKKTDAIISSIYNEAKAFSLRDRDETIDWITDEWNIKRFKTSCRNAENLILSDQVISKCWITWEELKEKFDNWINNQEFEEKKHKIYSEMLEFQAWGYDRKCFQLKNIRNMLVSTFLESNKPWEILVWQAIALNLDNVATLILEENSIYSYLWNDFVNNVLID